MKTYSIAIAALTWFAVSGSVQATEFVQPEGDHHSGDKHAQSASEHAEEGPRRVVQGRNDIEGEIIGTPAKGSAFAKLEIGMTQEEASALVPGAKQCGGYQTGKAWIPFRFSSNDNMRSECNYKGLGRLIYTQGKRGSFLLKIVNDAGESGIRS